MNLVVLLEDVATAAFNETLVDVAPLALGSVGCNDCWKPERLTNRGERIEVTTSANQAIVEGNDVIAWAGFLCVDWLDLGSIVDAVQRQDFTPNELDTHAALDNGLQREAQSIKMCGPDVATQDTRGVLEELLRISNDYMEVLLQVLRGEQPGELTTNDEHPGLCMRSHGCSRRLQLARSITCE